jgi:hypothetical protein
MITIRFSGKEYFMGAIQKLPFFLGASAAIIVGIISIMNDLAQQETYMKMGISMIAFFILGSYIKNTFLKIHEEVDHKRKEQKELERQKALAEQEAENGKNEDGTEKTHTVEYTVGDIGEDFSTYKVSEVLQTVKK